MAIADLALQENSPQAQALVRVSFVRRQRTTPVPQAQPVYHAVQEDLPVTLEL
jgi:hypothetical protein